MVSREVLLKRLKGANEELVDWIYQIAQRYRLQINIRNFATGRFLFTDIKGRSVAVSIGVVQNGWVIIDDPRADVAVIAVDGMVVGWIDSGSLLPRGSQVSVKLKALHPMPDKFDFSKRCPHMSVHGGWYTGEDWECLGCGQVLPFNDKRV